MKGRGKQTADNDSEQKKGEVMATFRGRFLQLHEETGKSIMCDALDSGLSYSTFRKLTQPSYHCTPNFNSITQLAKHYNVSTDYLLGISDVRREYGS